MFDGFQGQQRHLIVSPGQPAVPGFIALEDLGHPGLHITELDSVSRFTLGIHRPGQPSARVIETELGDVPEV